MSSQQTGAWIRRIFILLLIGGAAAGGYFFVMPENFGSTSLGSTTIKVTKENIKEVQGKQGVITITNLRVSGNAESGKLEQVLEKLKKDKYHEKIQLAELDIEAEQELATAAGVGHDLTKFAGHLDFHAEGRKIGDLVGQTDPKIVEAKIDEMLTVGVKRMDKNWLPEVPGMQRDRGQPVLDMTPAKKPAAPGNP
ncbi:hypothetical protein [Luteolibacter luteus]|uniref:Uncharacterized protein n=1 Tax=Luteolibacter luteus TaxID=2728835 RepID=A0A858RHS4_9BACT|nr:hypothetical protein [Luteolibacter luteus]QJE96427.1 hypothetical protein HHL09_11750 [Luteolibacter luteus]